MKLRLAQTDPVDSGQLSVSVLSAQNNFPISGAKVRITRTGPEERPVEELRTDTSGQTEEITVGTPPLEYSMEPGESRPYAEFTITVSAPGYESQTVEGTEVLPEAEALQNIRLRPLSEDEGARSGDPDSRSYPLRLLSAKDRRTGGKTYRRKRKHCFKPRRHAGDHHCPRRRSHQFFRKKLLCSL